MFRDFGQFFRHAVKDSLKQINKLYTLCQRKP